MIWQIDQVIESKTCLLPMITDTSSSLLRLYGHYKSGYLPFYGGVLDQPRAFVDAMEIIDGTLNSIRIDEAKNQRGRI